MICPKCGQEIPFVWENAMCYRRCMFKDKKGREFDEWSDFEASNEASTYECPECHQDITKEIEADSK